MKKFEAITLHRKVGCGNIYVVINEDEGVFYNIIIKGDNAKQAPCGESWLNTMAALLTYALRRSLWEGTTKEAIVKHMLNHRCQNIMANEEKIVSCSDAIGKVMLEYLKSRGLDETQKEKSKEENQTAEVKV